MGGKGAKMRPVPHSAVWPEAMSSKIGKKLILENKGDWFSSRNISF